MPMSGEEKLERSWTVRKPKGGFFRVHADLHGFWVGNPENTLNDRPYATVEDYLQYLRGIQGYEVSPDS